MDNVNDILNGKVTSIMTFGAFVQLEDGTSGLVHISEISAEYVKSVKDFLQVGQEVKVVALATEHDGKKRLSIKKAKALLGEEVARPRPQEQKQVKEPKHINKAPVSEPQNLFAQQPPKFSDLKAPEAAGFEDKLAKFMKDSEERLVDIKRQTDNKRGGGYVRRG